MKTFCVAIRDEAWFRMPNFSALLDAAVRENNETHKPSVIMGKMTDFGNQINHIPGHVLGSDVDEARQVYVLQNGSGERVSAREGSQASLDALADILRARGYRIVKTSAAG